MILKVGTKRRFTIIYNKYIVPVIYILLIIFLSIFFFTDLFTNSAYTKVYAYNSVEKNIKVDENTSISNIRILEVDVYNSRNVSINKGISKVNEKWWSYPSDIKETTKPGDDLLVLVNKEYKLPSTYIPNGLVSLNNLGISVSNPNHYARNIIINDLKQLNTDAKKDGISLIINSAYRSYSSQTTTYNYWLNINGGNIDVTDTISARSGHSQHQLGTTIDFSSTEVGGGIGAHLANSKTAKWIESNSWKYGFVIAYPKGYETITRYQHEWWHVRYIGIENAKEMRNKNMILEIYLRGKN